MTKRQSHPLSQADNQTASGKTAASRAAGSTSQPVCGSRHEVALVSHFLTPGWRAECSCGWTSPQREKSAQAERDFRAHREESNV